MKKIKSISLLIILVILFSCKNQNLDNENNLIWDNISSLRFYDNIVRPKIKMEHITNADLESIEFIETDLVLAKRILKESISKKDTKYIWKRGGWLVLATFKNGEKRKIKVSGYGSFFFDLEGQKYYSFEGNQRDNWKEFCLKYGKVLSNKRRTGA